MIVEVRLFATLRRYASANPNGVITVDVPEGTRIIDLIKKIKIDPSEVHLIMINGINRQFEEVVKSGDRIGLFPPVGGG